MATQATTSWWRRLSTAQKIGLGFALAGMLLALVGVARGNVPLKPLSIFLALLISGGSWGLVSWAIAAAASDVEQDLAEGDEDDQE